MSLNREQEALHAYLKLLKGKGVGRKSIICRENFIKKLIPLLVNVARNGSEYREALELCMDNVESVDWPYNLAVAREFFAFWIGDIKAIAAYNVAQGYLDEPVGWQPVDTSLKVLWDIIDKAKFDLAESWALKAYTKALRDENAPQTLIETRVKLAKILLIQLKDAPVKDNQAYRVSVDATVPLFDVKKNRHLFLAVVREFFHFWSGNPDAANFILQESHSAHFDNTTFQ